MSLRWENPSLLPLTRLHAGADINTPWKPGDMCTAWQDKRAMGLIVSLISDEQALILWSREPFMANYGMVGVSALAHRLFVQMATSLQIPVSVLKGEP